MEISRSTDKNERVAVAQIKEYDPGRILDALVSADKACRLLPYDLHGKKIVLKPNIVAKKTPDEAVTTHPAVVEAVVRWLSGKGADDITIAESPGGVYAAPRLRGVYAASGIDKTAEALGVRLNFDCTFSEIPFPEGVRCRLFDIITPILGADLVVDLCKLKTHALTGMSAAVKNMFGSIPGIVKFEMHSRFPDYGDFSEMLVDLCELICKRTDFISVTDGIVAMEGNGPTAGTPRKLGALIVSANPFAADVVSSHLIGRDGRITTVNNAAARGLSPAGIEGVNVIYLTDSAVTPLDFAVPDSVDKNGIEVMKNLFGGRIYRMFQPYPTIDYRACVGCGECSASCPQHTITMVEREKIGGKARASKALRVPKIERDACIRCFCCQELCPHGVVKIRKNPITRWLS